MHSKALGQLITMYSRDHLPRRRAEAARFRGMASLKEAVREAVLALDENGKIESHQRRVGRAKLGEYYRVVRRAIGRIGACRDFDELHHLMWSLRVPRVGALAVYDAAVKIGAFIKITPRRVYLHAGTREGARAVGVTVTKGVVELSAIPEALRGMPADDIENFLCIHKTALRTGRLRSKPCKPNWNGAKGVC